MDNQNSQFKPNIVQQSNQGNYPVQMSFKPSTGGINNQLAPSGLKQGIQPQQVGGQPQSITNIPQQQNNNSINSNQSQFKQTDGIETKQYSTKNEFHENQISNQNKSPNDVRIDINELNTQAETLKLELEQIKKSNKNLHDQLFLQEVQKKNQIKDMIQNVNKSEQEKNKLLQKIKDNQEKYQIQEQLMENSNQAKEIKENNLQIQQATIDKLEKENKILEQQLSSLSLQQKDSELKDQYESLEKQLKSLDQEIQKGQDELKENEEKKKVSKLNIFFRDQTINNSRDEKNKIEKKIKICLENIEQYKLEISGQQNTLNGKSKIIEQLEQLLSQGKLELSNDYYRLQNNDKMLIKQIQDSSVQSKKQEKTNSKILLDQRKRDQAELLEQNKLTRAKQLKEIQLKFKESHGQLEICFLIDCTGSMDPYKKQAELCVEQSMIQVKKQTQRDTLWSLVCYQDKAELKKLGSYKQLQFTDQAQEVTEFLQRIKCEGGDDAPEDLDGAIKQMMKTLNWKTKFKIAMVICDAPCHGTNFHDFGRDKDQYPDEDLTRAVELMIQNDLFFIGVIFTSHTNKMFEEIQKIYQRNLKGEYFFLYDLRNAQPDKIFEQLVVVLTAVSQTATQSNVKSTKMQTGGKVGIENATAGTKMPQSPIEILCKQLQQNQPNLDEFVNESFRVFRIEFSDQKFNEKYLEIQTINEDDFKQIEEGQWSCLRSKAPFASGAMKSAYLMIKQHQNAAKQKELYVCKTPLNKSPFKTFQSAIKECLVHLITQKWMKKFNRDLDEAIRQKGIKKRFPQIIYSDLLIFLDAQQNYWIGERFFEGEFVKYNNNFGYINPNKDDLNILGNSFSVYTFIKSNLKYLICDIQGVKCCFTDPAICTMKNYKLEQTDLGEDGIARFNVSFNSIKNSCQEILQILDINI